MSNKRKPRPSGQVHGVLLIDKPAKLTSFDVVAQVRRAFGTRRVGHAGTLDPMATGVLVVLLGEATKLSSVLSTDQKSYSATVQFGSTTNTLDREGAVTRRLPLAKPLDEQTLEGALRLERERRAQIPPQVSAIKVDGRRSYDQARKGIEVDLAPRSVTVHELRLDGFSADSAELFLTVSKGYYVRSLARDLAEHLGTVGHLTRLRRVKSGPFAIEETHPFPLTSDMPRLTIEDVAFRCLSVLELNDAGALCVRQGKRLRPGDVLRHLPHENSHGPSAALHQGRLIALVQQVDGDEYRVVRGLTAHTDAQASLEPTSAGPRAEHRME